MLQQWQACKSALNGHILSHQIVIKKPRAAFNCRLQIEGAFRWSGSYVPLYTTIKSMYSGMQAVHS